MINVNPTLLQELFLCYQLLFQNLSKSCSNTFHTILKFYCLINLKYTTSSETNSNTCFDSVDAKYDCLSLEGTGTTILPHVQLPLTQHLASTVEEKLNKLSAMIKVGQVKARFFDSYQMHSENFHTVRPMFTTLAKFLMTNHFLPQLQIKTLPGCNVMYLVVGHTILQFPTSIC
jgi:hypothetical protein